MHCRYATLCEQTGHKVKIFNRMPTGFARHIGSADGIIVFTSTVSHKMAEIAVREARRKKIRLLRSHSSSAAALINILEQLAGNAAS